MKYNQNSDIWNDRLYFTFKNNVIEEGIVGEKDRKRNE